MSVPAVPAESVAAEPEPEPTEVAELVRGGGTDVAGAVVSADGAAVAPVITEVEELGSLTPPSEESTDGPRKDRKLTAGS